MFLKNLKEQSSVLISERYRFASTFLESVKSIGFTLVDFSLLEPSENNPSKSFNYNVTNSISGETFVLRSDFTWQISNLVSNFSPEEVNRQIKFAYCGDVVKVSKPYKQKSRNTFCCGLELISHLQNDISNQFEELISLTKKLIPKTKYGSILEIQSSLLNDIATSYQLTQEDFRAIEIMDFNNANLKQKLPRSIIQLLKLSFNNDFDFVLNNVINPLVTQDRTDKYLFDQLTKSVKKNFDNITFNVSQSFLPSKYYLVSFSIFCAKTGTEIAKGGIYKIDNKYSSQPLVAMGITFYVDNFVI